MSNDSEDDDATPEADIEAEESTAREATAEDETADSNEVNEGAETDEGDESVDSEEGDDGADSEAGLDFGDFVRLEYTARTVDEGNLVDTTDGEVAEEADVDAEGREFGPRTVVLGEGHIFDTVEEDIVGSEVGDTGTVVVTADEAFGDYDEEQVKTVSKDKIPEDDQYPGAQVTIDGQQGFVETIIGGRARVDFNHPLAGEDIEYDWEIVGTVDDREEQASGLIEMFLDLDLDVHIETDIVEEEQLVEDEEEAEDGDEEEAKSEESDEEDAEDGDDDESESEDGNEDESESTADDEEPTYETVEVEKESLYIEATPQLSMNQQWMMQKQQIAQQLIDLLDIDRVVVQEVIEGGGMGGMMGGLGGAGGGAGDIADALEDVDIDADELAEEIE